MRCIARTHQPRAFAPLSVLLTTSIALAGCDKSAKDEGGESTDDPSRVDAGNTKGASDQSSPPKNNGDTATTPPANPDSPSEGEHSELGVQGYAWTAGFGFTTVWNLKTKTYKNIKRLSNTIALDGEYAVFWSEEPGSLEPGEMLFFDTSGEEVWRMPPHMIDFVFDGHVIYHKSYKTRNKFYRMKVGGSEEKPYDTSTLDLSEIEYQAGRIPGRFYRCFKDNNRNANLQAFDLKPEGPVIVWTTVVKPPKDYPHSFYCPTAQGESVDGHTYWFDDNYNGVVTDKDGKAGIVFHRDKEIPLSKSGGPGPNGNDLLFNTDIHDGNKSYLMSPDGSMKELSSADIAIKGGVSDAATGKIHISTNWKLVATDGLSIAKFGDTAEPIIIENKEGGRMALVKFFAGMP